MVFSDLKFWWFFAIAVALIVINARVLKSLRLQNVLLLVASYYFYAQWDWRFLGLIALSTVVDFVAGKMIVSREAQRKGWLLFSLIMNLGILGFFKYFDFFITEAVTGLAALGINASPWTLNVILPVGISFYTFQTLTYTLDIYRRQLEPTDDFIAFAAYVAFFPQLVAGPIERASNLLPQFDRLWTYNEERVTQGLRLILFGLALKIGVADNLAPVVDEIFANHASLNGGVLALGSVYFAFQIYGDFCGYSTIAIGTAKILDYELMTNFRTPYFALSVQEFWQRWHISLSTFFRDYVYIPLGGSRTTPGKKDRNVLVTFTVSGLWHGANWTFVFWGFYHGLLLAIQRRLPSLRIAFVPRAISNLIAMGVTFTLVCIGWVMFRSESLTVAYEYLTRAVTDFAIPDTNRQAVLFVLLAVFIDVLWRKDTRLETTDVLGLSAWPEQLLRWSAYVFLFWVIVIGVANRSGIQQFIYFQF